MPRDRTSRARQSLMSRRTFGAGAIGMSVAACGARESNVEPPAASPPPPAPATAPAVAQITDAPSLKSLLDAQVALKRAPAFAALVGDAGGVRLAAASGLRRSGGKDAVATTDVWHIGSCTKAMTAALYARLVQSGRAQWGATAAELFPDLADDIDPALRDTPVERFLQHRAGLADVGPAWLVARRYDGRTMIQQRAETAREWLTRRPGGEPGAFSYANVGYIIVGAAIERITGEPWEAALQQHVLQPLDMQGAGFGAPGASAPSGHRNGILGGFAPIHADNPAALGPAGTVHLALPEWAKFARVFVDPAQTFLSADSIERLTTPHAGEDYALGWGSFRSEALGRMIGHDGSNTFWHARATIMRDRNLFALYAANAYGDTTGQAFDALDAAVSAGVEAGTLL